MDYEWKNKNKNPKYYLQIKLELCKVTFRCFYHKNNYKIFIIPN